MAKIQGGYVLISVGQLANVCAARREREISFLALRVWLAAHEQRAKRCIAKRKLFTVAELAGFVRESEIAVQRALKQLSTRGLISWAEREIEFPRNITLDGEEIASDFGSSGRRPVPIPRQLLRALFRHTRPSEVIAAIAHLIRCLFIRKGEIKSGGLVKASAVAATLGIAERSVHAARKWLLSAGFLVQEALHQLVKNRFGGKFTIVIRPRVVLPEIRKSAPPSKTISTRSSTSNNQINNKPASAGSGVQTEHSGPPTLRDIRPEDLRKPHRLELLYREAVKAGWLEHSEANVRNFACAALRATRSGGRVGAIFVGIVRKQLWHHITQDQEDRALSVLNRFRQQHANAFGVGEAHAPQSDARLSDLAAAVLQRRPTEQRRRLNHAEGHARRASAGDPHRERPEVGRCANPAADSSSAGCVKKGEQTFRAAGEVDNFRPADQGPMDCGTLVLSVQVKSCPCNSWATLHNPVMKQD